MNSNHRTAPLIAILTGLLLLAVGPLSHEARAQFGVSGGLNFNQLDDIRTENARANFESATGYHVGVFYDAALGPIALRPGVMYRRVGEYRFPEVDGPDDIGLPDRASFDISQIEVPIDVRWRVLPLPLVTPYVLASPVLTFPRTEGDVSDGVRSANLTADIGAGAEIRLPGMGLTLMPELRYGIGATSFLEEEFTIGDTTIRPLEQPRLNAVILRLNVRF